MSCTVDFLFYTGYINNSDQIADTCEACNRGRVPRPLFFTSKKPELILRLVCKCNNNTRYNCTSKKC